MKVLYLFNGVKKNISLEAINEGKAHDSEFFGMLRLPKYGVQAESLEIEKYIPEKIARFLRKHLLTMHYAHLPLFPLFFKYDVVFTSTAYSSLLLKALLGIKKFKWVILDFNISGTIGEGKTLREKLFKWAVSKADGIVTISQAEKDILEHMFPHLKGKIEFIYEATDPTYFKPLPDIPEEDFILSVGKDPGRDFDTLVKVAEETGIRVKLATRPMRVKNLHPLPESVSVHTFSHADMLTEYAKAKIVVIGLKQKGEGDSMGTLSIGEAMAMGKPLVVTHNKSVESYVIDGKTGLLIEKQNIESLKQALSVLQENSQLRTQLGASARQFALEYLDADRFAQQIALFLTKIGKK